MPDRTTPLSATETRERIVVAISGAGRDEELIRRAGRLAARSAGAQLHAVHVARSSRLSPDGSASAIERQPLVTTLGGTYHAVIGDSVAEAIAAFAHRVGATQIVVGQSGRGRIAWLRRRGLADVLAARSGGVDVHVVPRPDRGVAAPRLLPPLERALSWQRRVLGLVIAAVLLSVLTVIATASGSRLGLAADVPLYLLVVVLTSLIGGIVAAIVSALAASLLLNYYFTAPRHTFNISQASDVVAVVVFLLIALAVSRLVDVAARRADLAARAGAEAQALTTFATGLLRGEVGLPDLLRRVRETFEMTGASLLQADDGADRRAWRSVATDGETAPSTPDAADASADLGGGLVLAMRGHPLGGADQRVFSAVAGHVAIAYRQQELALAARDARRAAEADRQRTALLNAVGHDLRTPIASAKIAVASLRATEVSWSPAQRGELLAGAEDALDRLTDLVTNLLDLSRLQADALPVLPVPVGLGDVVARALDHLATSAHLDIDVPDDLPEIVADAGLLERVVANLVQNALRYTPGDTLVRVAGSAHRDHVQLRVIDRGPGIAPEATDAAFRAFQRTDDLPTDGAGVGLGLAIARGFTEAMGGTVEVEQTPGGGATFVVTLRAVA